jgi:hypothetical protein
MGTALMIKPNSLFGAKNSLRGCKKFPARGQKIPCFGTAVPAQIEAGQWVIGDFSARRENFPCRQGNSPRRGAVPALGWIGQCQTPDREDSHDT